MGFFSVKNCPIVTQKQNIINLWITFKKKMASFFGVEKSLKLIIKSVEKFNFERQYLIFSSVFCCQFVSLTLFFHSQKKQTEFKNLSEGTCRSVKPTSRECQTMQLVLNFFDVAIHFSPGKQGSKIYSRSQSIHSNSQKNISFKMH